MLVFFDFFNFISIPVASIVNFLNLNLLVKNQITSRYLLDFINLKIDKDTLFQFETIALFIYSCLENSFASVFNISQNGNLTFINNTFSNLGKLWAYF